MEKDNILNLMESYDFNAPINVTVLIDEDETILADNTDEAKTVIKSEVRQVSTDNTTTENFIITNNENTVNNMDIENQIRYHNNKQNKKKVEKRKSTTIHVHSNKTNSRNIELEVPLGNREDNIECGLQNSNKDTADKNMNLDIFNKFNPFVKDFLKIISQHLILIIEAYLFYKEVTKDTKQKSESNNIFLRTKIYLFSLSYSTVLAVLLPQENNKTFIDFFLQATIQLANDSKSIQIPYKELKIVFFEMLKWTKQRKEILENMSFSNITSNYNNCHDVSSTPSQLSMSNIRHSQHSNLLPHETTRYFRSTYYANPPLENFKDNNTAPTVFSTSIPRGRSLPMPINSRISTGQSDKSYSITSGNMNLQPTKNTGLFLHRNETATLPTTTLPSSNLAPLLSKITSRSIPPRNAAPIMQGRYPAPHNISSLSAPGNTTLMSQTNIAPVSSRQLREIPPNTCIFAAGPPGKEVSIHVPSYTMLNTPNNNVYQNYSQVNTANPTMRRNHLPHIPQNNACGQIISDVSRINYKNTTNPNFQRDNSQSCNILTAPCQSQYEIHLATSQNSSEVQQLQYNPNKQTELQMESRRSISTDSGFTSPLPFVSAEQMVTTSYAQQNKDPNNMPFIINVTSLNPNVSTDERTCRVCRKATEKMCLGCFKCYYCSDDCQKIDWVYHMVICKGNEENL